MRKKVLIYLSFGIFGSVVSILLALSFYFIFENNNQNLAGIKMEVVPDLLLATFAIASSTISILFDSADDTFYLCFKGIISAFSALVGFAMYYSVFGYITAVNNIMVEMGNIDKASEAEIYEASRKIEKAKDLIMNNNVKWDVLIWVALGIILINIIVGISAIYRDSYSRKTKKAVDIKNETVSVEKEGTH